MTGPRAAVAALLVSAAVVMWLPPAGAVDSVASGWWWREQPDDGALPAPPHVPDGGLRVASDASGASAVAAVRVPLASGETDPVLTLKVAAGSPQSATITACPPKAPWTPASAGAWSSRPEPDCSGGAAAGSVAPDGSTVVFDLSPVAVDPSGAVDVVLFTTPVPLPVSAGPAAVPVPTAVPPTFDVAFTKPTAADVAVSAGGADAGAVDDGLGTSPEGPAFDLGPTALLDTPLGASLDLGRLDPPAQPPGGSAGAAATGAPAVRPGAASSPGVVAPLQRLVGAWDRVGEARDRLLAAFVFVDLLAGWWLLERRRSKLAAGGVAVDVRPRISLHDDPAAVLAAHAARLARHPSSPTIDVPPLR